jgi:hypothetical protein
MKIALIIAALLAAYVAVCWLLAFLLNMASDLGRRAARRLLTWIRALREWRAFAAAHRAEFTGPQFRWPETGAEPAGDASW